MSLRRLVQVLHSNCLPALRVVADQLNRAAFSTSAPTSALQQSPEDSLFVGAYTPVTKQLWQDRLKLAQQQSAAQGAAAQDALAARPPKQTVVKYPFTTDRVLLELVSNHQLECHCRVKVGEAAAKEVKKYEVLYFFTQMENAGVAYIVLQQLHKP
jgi:hypothetical protein